MQPFICPQCGHESSFDPWSEAAHCPQCDFSPPADGPKRNYVQWATRYSYQQYLDELVAHWDGASKPDPDFSYETSQDAIDFFQEYRHALGSDAPNYFPNRQEILILAEAYAALRRGQREVAAQDLGALTLTSPLFVDPWVWLTATTDDPARRRNYLESATRLDSGHTLARDARALFESRLAGDDQQQGPETPVTQCSQCGGQLQYEPGAAGIECSQCGRYVQLDQVNLIDGPAEPIHGLRLKRRYKGHSWKEAEQLVHCHGCGAEMVMTKHLVHSCAFCGSVNVLVEDNQRILEQPDGFLPFQVNRQQADLISRQGQIPRLQRIKKWMGGPDWSLNDLQSVYLPFWVFDGTVETYRTHQGFGLPRKESLTWDTYENLSFSGVQDPPESLLSHIFPFDLRVLVPYEPRLLADWPARLYKRDVELVSEQARASMLDKSWRRASGRLAGEKGQLGFQVIEMTYQLVLLPLWLAVMEAQNLRRLALVNGQTGKMALSPVFRPARDVST